MRHWFDTSDNSDIGFIGFIDTGSAWVVAGEPVAAHSDSIAVAERFVNYAHANEKRVSFFATEGALASSPRFRRVLIGEQPTWNPQEWTGMLSTNRSLREQLRRARAKGVQTREIGVAEIDVAGVNGKSLRETLNSIVRRWLATRPMPSMHFLVELEPFAHFESRRLFVAERDGVAIAFLSAAPVAARKGWLFEHLLRDPDAPNGSTELLVDCAMRTLSAQGVSWATLGLAPLAGDVSGWLRMTRMVARPFFNFRGLASFKGKLRPSNWEAIYLVYPRERSSVWAMRDGLRAFAGGSLWMFGVRTVLRGPKPLLRALEYSLIPWTLALALWPAEPWFPKSHVKWAWVAFDVLLWSVLYRLRKHWTQRLAVAIAVTVSLDTV
ncbi:MAG: phosphatidylglycerol lysyltransferase domain-containing protein, partial [Gemmatimonadaceae bacterium]